MKHTVTVTAISFTIVLMSLGCSQGQEEPSSALVKRAADPTLVLTSAAPVAAVETTMEAPKTELAEEASPAQPEPEPEVADPPSFEPTLESMDGLTIRRFVTTSEIEAREPIGATSSFNADHDQVYAFVEVSNEAQSPKKLLVHFIGPEAKVTGGILLEIPASAPRWRTWAYTKHFDEPGLWRVEIRDEGGYLLGALPFAVEPLP